MVFLGSAGDSGHARVYHAWRVHRALAMELAVAAAVRLAPDHLLAGAGAAGSVPHSVRQDGNARIRRRVWDAATHAGAHVRTLGEHDARGARALPAGNPRPLRHGAFDERSSVTFAARSFSNVGNLTILSLTTLGLLPH